MNKPEETKPEYQGEYEQITEEAVEVETLLSAYPETQCH